jgi:hypothetical protein
MNPYPIVYTAVLAYESEGVHRESLQQDTEAAIFYAQLLGLQQYKIFPATA